MYKITEVDVKNNRYKVTDTGSNVGNICTKEQLLKSRDLGFKVFGVLQDGQVVVWDTFYKLSLLSDNGKKKLMEILKDYDAVVVTDDDIINEGLTGNCMVFNASNFTSMYKVFEDCKAVSLDLSSFDTSNVTDMNGMFRECKATSLDLRNLDTSKVTDMSGMFWGCKAASLDLSSFDTSNVTDMACMFAEYKASSLDLRNFDTSNVTDMRYMFSMCKAEVIDLSSFDTSSVTDMGHMFRECKAASLDLSNFDTSNVEVIVSMFRGYLGKEIILRKDQTELINQAKEDGQEVKIRYV